MTEGLTDEYTPPKSIEILAATARMPIVGTAHSINSAQEILGHSKSSSVQENRKASAGDKITAGLVQFPEDGHFAIFWNDRAADIYRKFFETTLEGSAKIDSLE